MPCKFGAGHYAKSPQQGTEERKCKKFNKNRVLDVALELVNTATFLFVGSMV
jgi:hypothetical protein